MAWHYVITPNLNALTQAQKEENATEFYNYFAANGYMTKQAIAGILGNIQREGQMNPGQQEYGYGGSASYGYGLIGWTPGSLLVNWASSMGLNWYDGSTQCLRIKSEGERTNGAGGTWIPTSDYPYSWNEFRALTNVEEATKSYLAERERAGVSALAERLQYANEWYSFLQGISTPLSYSPRLSEPTTDSIYWLRPSAGGVNECIEIANGSVLPNCVGYAWGRAYELLGSKPTLSKNDAGVWYPNTADGYDRGSTPRLGAVICWSRPGEAGHVAIVEKIEANGKITTSNSDYGGRRFYTTELTPSNGDYSFGAYVFQGFIYLPISSVTPPIPGNMVKKNNFNFLLFSNNRKKVLRNEYKRI